MTVVEELGRGADAVVYRALRERDGVGYALKVLCTVGDEREAAAFRREAALLASMNHPGLARVHEVGTAEGSPYLVMDLVEGRSLAVVLRAEGGLAETRVAALGAEVADILTVVHRAGLTHRDIKPDNIMVCADGRARLIDFGLAGITGADAGEAAVGTFAYSAPEQTGMLARPVDGRADLYGLGVVLFECLTGTLPFTAVDVGELVRQHLAEPAADVRTLRGEVSADMAALVATLLAKDPDDRYQSAQTVRDELIRLAGTERVLAVSDGSHGHRSDADGGLVGRDGEVQQLIARWKRTDERGGVTVVSGPPGSGKSRLVSELTATASEAGSLVLFGKCVRDEATPLGPLRGAIDDHVRHLGRLTEPQRQVGLDRLRTAGRASAGHDFGMLGSLSPTLGAILDGDTRQAAQADPRLLVETVATFLAGLATAAGRAVLHLDDIQWCDELTRQVVRRLGVLLPEVPLLVVATARDDPASQPIVDSLLAELGPACDLRLTLGELDGAGMAELARHLLGGCPAPAELVAAVTTRSDGSPLAVVEYIRAVIDAGLLRPHWGGWVLDHAGLAAVDLPKGVMELVLRRVDSLGAEVRRLLTTAAAIGRAFAPELVAAVCRVELAAALGGLADAAAYRLIESNAAGYMFVHDRVQEALLGDLDEAERQTLHQCIAEEMDRSVQTSAPPVYALARHYLAGHTDRNPRRAFEVTVAAGRFALAEHAPADALDYLLRAESLAQAGGLGLDVGFHTAVGMAASRVGQFTLADEHFDHALAAETDSMRRAGLYALAAESQFHRWASDSCAETAMRGLAQMGHPLPRNPLMLLISTIGLLLASWILGRLPHRVRTVTGDKREQLQLRARLAEAGLKGAGQAARRPLMLAFMARGLYAVKRLGPGPEFVRIQGPFALMVGIAGLRRSAERILSQITAAAADSGDPQLINHNACISSVVADNAVPMSATTGQSLIHALQQYGKTMDLGDLLSTAGIMAQFSLLRGYVEEPTRWHRRILDQAPASHEVLGSIFAPVGAQLAALAGRRGEAAALFGQVRDFLATTDGNQGQQIVVSQAALYLAVECGETGEELDRAVAEFADLKVPAAFCWPFQRAWWVYQAFGRLAQAAAAPPEKRGDRLATARAAVNALRQVANGPVLKAYHRAAKASLRQLQSDHAGALRLLEPLDGRCGGLDVPMLDYEVARIRARAYSALGRHADCTRHAQLAQRLAEQYGWHTRARWIRDEFAVDSASSTAPSSRVTRTRHGSDGALRSGTGELSRRRLEAVQQVSLAAATVLDVTQLARVALDEIVRIFAAERAFLFLREGDDGGRLAPYLGRDTAGMDIEQPTGYGSTLVHQVDATGEPLVVTGSEQGAALGSQSAVVHGLRSIMVAPLSLKDRILGVIYLDSRAAKGIFTTDDIHTLTAITNQVALALETTRAAQLDAAVRAAERERDVAETLRQAVTGLAASLDPQEVGDLLIATICRTVPVDAAVLLHSPDGARLTLVAAAPSQPQPVNVTSDPDLIRLLAAPTTLRGTDAASGTPPAALGPHIGAWLAVPILVRGEHRGLLLAGTSTSRPYTDAEVEIVTALAGHGMVAFDNALLFAQIQELATRDGLTGLLNRRHFMQLSDRTREPAGPMATIMVDIDHFKRINDTHGHPVGDAVIREVAARLSNTLRPQDLICRYGGEEFAILLPGATSHQAASIAERLLAAVTSSPIPTPSGDLDITVSIGVADTPVDPEGIQTLLIDADAALYQAKRSGRNRVTCHSSTSTEL